MDNFSNYKIADIHDKYNKDFMELENYISKDTNKEIVLIAYEKK